MLSILKIITKNLYERIVENSNKNNVLHSIMIEIQSICNWRCKHCYIPNYTKQIKTEKILDILKELREMGTFEVVLTGGEIFYRNDTIDIIRIARNMGFNVTLMSNISLLDEYKIKELKNLFISTISCTVFSLDEEIHDFITNVKGSLKKILENIYLINEYDIPLEIKMPVLKYNQNCIDKLHEFCIKNNLKFKPDLSITTKLDGDTEPQNLMLENNELERLISKVDNIVGYRKFKENKDNQLVCERMNCSLSINSDGDINPCNLLPIPIGNIYKDRLKDIWKNSELLCKLSKIKYGDLENCKKCDVKDYCVRCPGTEYMNSGRLYGCSNLSKKIATVRYNVDKKEDFV